MKHSAERCRVCDTPIRFTSRLRYVCCNGHDCGCYGATLPDDICSEGCLEAADRQKDKEAEAEGVTL